MTLPLFESEVDTPKKVIPASANASNEIIICDHQVLNVEEGERIRVDAWAIVDANAGLIGTTMGIAFFDVRYPTGYMKVRWPAPSVHKWGGGNVKRADGEHHKALTAEGHYLSPKFQRRVRFALWVAIYSTAPAGLSATVQDCAMTFERFKAD